MMVSFAISPSLYDVSPDARHIGLFKRRVVTMHRNAKPSQNLCPIESASKGFDTKPQIALRQRVGDGVRSCMRLLTMERGRMSADRLPTIRAQPRLRTKKSAVRH